MLNPDLIRVRFAPSPTGPIHLGSLRTALYNYLFARKNNGTFILRIEDTDDKRLISHSEIHIQESLKWCGIIPDEGVGVGGPYAPYYQSQRGNIYLHYLNKLLKKGLAYYAFDTDEDLKNQRKKYQKIGLNFSYNHQFRMQLDNSLSMNHKELSNRLKCHSYVVRFRVQPGRILKVHDCIRGNLEINTDYLDDKILLKSNGLATYHLANTIDDHIMKISHVLRGEEWISSMFFHILIYQSFGWTPPIYAHLPLILRKDGKGKISKRILKNNLDFPLFPIEWKMPNTNMIIPGYKELGYFPESFINMLALLGWNPGNNQEIFSFRELIQLFSIKKIKKAGVFFDIKKAAWFNKQYIIDKKKEIFLFLKKKLKKRSISLKDENFLWKVINLTIDRIHFIHEIWKHANYFFIHPCFYDMSLIEKIGYEIGIIRLKLIKKLLIQESLFTFDHLKYIFSNIENKKCIMQLLRLSLIGSLRGINLFVILEMLGKKEILFRIEKYIQKIKFLYLNRIHKK